MAAKFMFRAIRGRIRTVYALKQNLRSLQASTFFSSYFSFAAPAVLRDSWFYGKKVGN
jgi:hypothetical protein